MKQTDIYFPAEFATPAEFLRIARQATRVNRTRYPETNWEEYRSRILLFGTLRTSLNN